MQWKLNLKSDAIVTKYLSVLVLKAFQVALRFLSLMQLSFTQRFYWPESSISDNFKANQNLYLQNIAEEVGRSKGLCSQGKWDVDRKKDKDRI